MPLIGLQLKTIYSTMTSFLLVIALSSRAQAFDWPFSTEDFQKKLSSKDLTPSTRYYARGPSFFSGQKWLDSKFHGQLQQQNYRIRDAEQVLMAGDAKKLPISTCKSLTSLDLNESWLCWMWQSHDQETYTVVVNDQQIIDSTWIGAAPERYWKASLDPILVAQYKGQQPIMQNELKISDFPVNCLNAVMAIEDSEFLNHSGLSYMGLTRSLIKNISKMRYAQGGSTITQQLVKNYFLTPEKTISRKLKELYLAVKLESEWTKDQILETYLNIIYMGQSGAFQVLGFGAASQYYFNKPVQQLNLAECSLMAAIVNNPGLFNPWRHADKAATRRATVLTKMKELSLITETEFNEASKVALPKEIKTNAAETAPYFFEAVRKQMGELKISSESQNIYTSLDLEAQQNAQSALQKHISELEKNRKNLIKNKAKGLRLEGLVLSTENQTGLVNTLVGGQSYLQTQFNRALNGRRQIGSLIKPYVYLSALINGIDGNKAGPLTILNDALFIWKYDKKTWTPENYEKKFNGEIPLYFALKESLNAPTAQVAQKVGLDQIIELTHQIGFTSNMENSPATSLGASVHYPIEILDSYRTLANQGQFTRSGFIEKIKNKDNEVVYEFKPNFEPKLEPASVAVLIGMMKETLKSGTAKSAAALGWNAPAAGKTGTTSDNKDAWFTGFTPFQTTVVWLGYDQGASSQLTGGSGAVPVWVDIMKKNLNIWPDTDFKWPDNVEKQIVTLHGTNKETEMIFKKY
ncbi:penicillin-binding protein [bacterium]|nr:penicillin-binding protein [bacterium]